MEVVFNNQYTYPISYARQGYDKFNGEGLYISFNYSQELYEELLEFFNTTDITNIKIIKNEKEIYTTDIFVNFMQMNNNFSDSADAILSVNFIKKS